MHRNDPKSHAPIGRGTVCNSNSVAAIHRTADCERCVKRLDDIGAILIDAANGKDVSKRAAAMVKKLGIHLGSIEGEETL
jgi:hypothetical protein